MSHTHDARGANLVGALSLAVVDRLARVAEDAAGHGGTAPAALVSLATYLDGSSIDVLRQPLGLSHSAAVRLTDRLEAAGFLERADGADARSVSVRLTRRGADTGARILEERTAALETVLAPLARSERSDLARLHEKLLAGITSGRHDAGRICRLCDPHACGHFEGRCPVTAAADAADRSPR